MKNGWEIKKLTEIGKVFNGNSVNAKVKKEKYTGLENGLPYIATKDVGFDSVIDYENGVKIPWAEKEQFKIAPSNTPLICAEGGSAGRKIGFTNQKVCFGNKLFALIPNKNVDGKFLYYYYFSSSFQKLFSTEMVGIIGGVSMNKFKSIEISLPPLPEQQRIVAILDKAFAAIDKAIANAERNHQNSKELFESYLQGVFEKKGDGWEEKTFEDLSSRIGDGLHGTPKYDDKGDYYFINGNNLNDGVVEIKESTKKINKEEFEKHKRELTNNTVLISINGTLGKVAFYNDEPVILGKSACYINFNDEVNKHYIKYLVKSPLFFKNMASNSTGATIKNFSLKSMRNYSLPLPSIEEQKEIVNKLDNISAEMQKMEALYQKKLDDLEELKKSILQKAFAGELRRDEAFVAKSKRAIVA